MLFTGEANIVLYRKGAVVQIARLTDDWTNLALIYEKELYKNPYTLTLSIPATYKGLVKNTCSICHLRVVLINSATTV